jgi:hypothetical protein
MSPEAQNVLRLANVLATRRVRRYAITQASYRGSESEIVVERAVEEARTALEAAVEELDKERTT